MAGAEPIAEHYAAGDIVARVTAALATLGKDPAHVTVDDLAPVDEFHSRGAVATDELIAALGVTAGDHVLDIGAGIGGPARRLAAATGCRVTGIDLGADFVAAGNRLTEWVGLQDQVELVCGDATDLGGYGDATFDAAWTIHVGMNIAAKPALYAQVARVLKHGAPFVVYDILRGPAGGPVDYPMPWATDAASSFLATPDEMRGYLTAAGFADIEVTDLSAPATGTFAAIIAKIKQDGPPPLGLHVLMGPRFAGMVANLHAGLAAGNLAVARFVAHR